MCRLKNMPFELELGARLSNGQVIEFARQTEPY